MGLAMRKVFLLILVLVVAFSAPQVRSASMTNYCYVPPYVSSAVKPNVLIVMDFSGSMQFPAYLPCNFSGYTSYVAECGSSNSTYNPSNTYKGYFDPN
ncbi:MAG: hypothetical protein ACPLRS_05780, partial [Hydrogenobacter sp.]